MPNYAAFQPAPSAAASSLFETTVPPPADTLPATANGHACPACGFTIRQVLTTVTVCPNCNTRRPQIAALRSRLVAKWPGRGAWWKAAEVRNG
jgi:hypothetical protein